MRKFSSIILVLTVLFSIMSGCSSKDATTQTNGSTVSSAAVSSEKSDDASKTNEYGWAVPEKTLEISYYAGQGDPERDAKFCEKINQYILEKFNVKLNRIIYDVNATERLNLMLASSDYPDMLVGVDSAMMEKWKSLGHIKELTPLVEQYGPNIKKELGDLYKRFLDKDGKLFVIPRNWGMDDFGGYAAYIRWDWYSALGSPKVETTEDYYNLLKQMLAAHPTNAKGEKNYAMSWIDFMSIKDICGFWGLKEEYKEDADHNLTHWINTPEGLDMCSYYNRFYREGMLDPNAFINKYDDWKAKFSSERILGQIGTGWVVLNAGHEVWQKTMSNWTDDMRFVPVKIKAPGVEQAYLAPKNANGSDYTVITDKCADPEGVIKFIDFVFTPMGTRLLAWGIPNLSNSVWNYEGGTEWSFSQDSVKALEEGTLDWDDKHSIGLAMHSICFPNRRLSDDNDSHQYFNGSLKLMDLNKWSKRDIEISKGTQYDNSARQVTWLPENPLTATKQQIDDLVKAGFAKVVMSKTEESFKANYNELKDKLNKIGLPDIEKFLSDEYRKNLEAWK